MSVKKAGGNGVVNMFASFATLGFLVDCSEIVSSAGRFWFQSVDNV
jgi:hypothetical protein